MASKTPDEQVPDFTPKPTVLTKDNLLVSGSVVLSAIGLTWFFAAKLNSIERKLDEGWTRDQMREYDSRFNKMNPQLTTPNVDQVAREVR